MVVACTGHTCINRTSFKLLNMPDITIAVAQRCRKSWARKLKIPIICLWLWVHVIWLAIQRKENMTPASVRVCIAFFPHYVHNCGENAQGAVWNVRGPCCFNNKSDMMCTHFKRSHTSGDRRAEEKPFSVLLDSVIVLCVVCTECCLWSLPIQPRRKWRLSPYQQVSVFWDMAVVNVHTPSIPLPYKNHHNACCWDLGIHSLLHRDIHPTRNFAHLRGEAICPSWRHFN